MEGGEGIKKGKVEVLVMSKARQENRISGREKLNIFYTNARSLNWNETNIRIAQSSF